MEIVRSKRAAKRPTRRAAAQGEGSTTERRQSSTAQTSQDYRARSSSTQKSFEYRARGEVREEEAEEKQHWQQGGNGPEPSLPNVAAHFATLVNAILKRIEEERTRDKVYDEFMKDCKNKIIYQLKRTCKDLEYFYANPSCRMPSCLSNSPPAAVLYTEEMDMRLSGKVTQIQEDLLAFVEELGFFCLYVNYGGYNRFSVSVRLDIATVLTTDSPTNVENRLRALESFLQREFFSSKP